MEKKPNIHAGHRQRVKILFLKTGGFYMEDHQLLELLLFYSVPRKDTNPLAHRLLNRFGSLFGVLNATPEALLEEKGVSVSTVALLKLVARLIARHQQGLSAETTHLDSLEEAEQYLGAYFLSDRDKIWFLSLNDNGQVLSVDYQDGMGSTCTHVDLRSLVTEAARTGATRMVVALPRSGAREVPSVMDMEEADRCQQALGALSVRLWDVLLFSEEGCISMRRRRLLH